MKIYQVVGVVGVLFVVGMVYGCAKAANIAVEKIDESFAYTRRCEQTCLEKGYPQYKTTRDSCFCVNQMESKKVDGF